MRDTGHIFERPAEAGVVRGRILALDLARAAALLAMAVFHLAFDLELFGFAPPGTTMQPGWRWLAFLTAGSFLFLVGVSLWLAHGQGIRWRGVWTRLAMIAGAAGVITAATFVAMPHAFIFFGILHCIAVASLLGLAFLRLPALVLIALGLAVLWLPQLARFDLFDPPWLWWTGLQATAVRSVDYVPIFPWFGPVLLGLAAGRLMSRAGLWERLSRWQAPPLARALAWPGRHSLAVYLVHQPVLIALVWTAAQLR
ncbi:DUF1624 domain-containing protein [Roseicyclus persicicus]|uniref:DUF1624 domain-containing protein n=1 Tax=Roseicyclus persicicus TaxID=2650661 RepID=A0A7X6JWP8_9RHOB|nr:heparan-alpha-glucosaminide N-acetyltransferase [Roseibacterium persicicum]NKX44682.1 DUF1624 domain-containing protein [Roseibacterium persicicum]